MLIILSVNRSALKTVKDILIINRKVTFKMHGLTRSRMHEGDRPAVKSLTREPVILSSRSIDRITYDRMTNISHMHSYLMGPSGLQDKLYIRYLAKPVKHLEMSDGRFPSLITAILRLSVCERPIGASTMPLSSLTTP